MERLRKGRKPGVMTARRKQVLEAMTEAAASGERIGVMRLARKCGLYDYRDARRIVRDLRRMGVVG